MDHYAESPTRTPRQMAGRALLLFFIVMAILTMLSRTLQEMSIANVQSTRPQRGALERRIQGEGTLFSSIETPLVIPHAVRVLDVYVRAGSAVTQGEALCLLDYTTLLKEKYETLQKAQQESVAKQQAFDWAAADVTNSALERMARREEELERAQQALNTAEAAYDEAVQSGSEDQAQLKTTLQLAEQDVEYARNKLDGYSRVRDYLTKQGELENALQAEQNAGAEYQKLLSLLDDAPDADALPPYDATQQYLRTVTAPIEGSVQALNIQSGAMVSTDAPALKISPVDSTLSLEVPVEVSQIGDVQVGDVADIVIDGRIHECTVTAVAPSKTQEGMHNVRFDLAEGIGSTGMRATMYFRKRTQSYDLLVPLSALRNDVQGDFVYVIHTQDSSLGTRHTLSRVTVSVLERDATRAAVSGGLAQGDTLATRGDRTLSDGDRVRLAGE